MRKVKKITHIKNVRLPTLNAKCTKNCNIPTHEVLARAYNDSV